MPADAAPAARPSFGYDGFTCTYAPEVSGGSLPHHVVSISVDITASGLQPDSRYYAGGCATFRVRHEESGWTDNVVTFIESTAVCLDTDGSGAGVARLSDFALCPPRFIDSARGSVSWIISFKSKDDPRRHFTSQRFLDAVAPTLKA